MTVAGLEFGMACATISSARLFLQDDPRSFTSDEPNDDLWTHGWQELTRPPTSWGRHSRQHWSRRGAAEAAAQ